MKRKQKDGRKGGLPPKRASVNWFVVLGALLFVTAFAVLGPGLLKPGRNDDARISNSLSSTTSSNINARDPSTPAATNLTPSAMDDPVKVLNYGTELLSQGKVDEAIAMYQRALKLNAEDEEVHFNLGYAYAMQGRTEDAIKHYAEALKIFPEYVEAHNNL